jgi:hypothetical protein
MTFTELAEDKYYYYYCYGKCFGVEFFSRWNADVYTAYWIFQIHSIGETGYVLHSLFLAYSPRFEKINVGL